MIDHFQYRKKITIDGASGAGTDYPIKLLIGKSSGAVGEDFDLGGNCADDFSDIRFVSSDIITALPYWVESVVSSGTSYLAIVWVKITDDISSGTIDLYIQYGYTTTIADGGVGADTFVQFGIATQSVVANDNPYQNIIVGNDNTALTLHRQSGDGELHPNVIYFPDGKDGYKYWMIYTPYPADADEDIHVERSHDGITWVDTGISNPVIAHGGGGWKDTHLADPDAIWVGLYSKFFCAFVGFDGTDVQIGLAYSSDGKTWTDLGVLIDGSVAYELDSGGDKEVVQPALWFDTGSNTFNIWYIVPDAVAGIAPNGRKICLATFTWDDVTPTFNPITRNANNPVSWPIADSMYNQGIGHPDVWYDPDDGTYPYYMYAVRSLLNQSLGNHWELDLLRSTDKETWTSVGKALPKLAQTWGNRFIYRTCVMTQGNGEVYKDSNDLITIFFSAANREGTYSPSIGIATTNASRLMYALDAGIWTKEQNDTAVSVSAYGSDGGLLLLGGSGTDAICLKGQGHTHGHACRWRGVFSNTTAAAQICSVGWYDGADSTSWIKQNILESGHGAEYAGAGDGTNSGIDTITGDLTVSARATWEIQRYGDAASPSTKMFEDDVALTIPNAEDEDFTGTWYPKLHCRDNEDESFLIVDWYLVRKIVATEPSFNTAGTEEENWYPREENQILIFRGEDSPDHIDYDTPIASRVGSGNVTISDQEHKVETKYYYAARQISKYGRLEANRHILVEVELDAGGTLRGTRPDRVRNVSAERQAAGTVRVRFSFSRGEGTQASLFTVYYDQGNGAHQIDIAEPACKLGTVTARGNGRYTYTTTALTDATEYAFAVTAEDADGNESKLSGVAACRADATAPAGIPDLTAATVL